MRGPRRRKPADDKRFEPEARLGEYGVEVLRQRAPCIEIHLQQSAHIEMHARKTRNEMHWRSDPHHASVDFSCFRA